MQLLNDIKMDGIQNVVEQKNMITIVQLLEK
jgi:hypothetical protein